MPPKKATKKHHPLIESWWIPLILLGVGMVAIFFIPKPSDTNNENAGSTNENVHVAPSMTIPTADGINLAAEFHAPASSGSWPAIILVHSFGLDRHQWDPYWERFISAGIGVLTYDVRGFGQSPVMTRYTDILEFSGTWPNDIPALIDYLRQQPGVDPTRISVMGIGSGGLVALTTMGQNIGLYRAVVVKPDMASGLLPAAADASLHPSGILFLTDQPTSTTTRSLYDRAIAPKDFQLLTNDTADLLANETIWPAAISWISN